MTNSTEQAAVAPQQHESAINRFSDRITRATAGVVCGAIAMAGISLESRDAYAETAEQNRTVQTKDGNHRIVSIADEDAIIVGTYNILGSNHTRPGGYYGKQTDYERAIKSTNIIKGLSDTPRMDIVGLQEMMPDQKQWFDRMLSGYDSFSAGPDPRNTIYYRAARFDLKASGFVLYPTYGDRRKQKTGRAPWVRLSDEVTGKTIISINAHLTAHDTDNPRNLNGSKNRARTARILERFMSEEMQDHPKAMVTVGADWNAWDVAKKRGPADRWTGIDYKDRGTKLANDPICRMTRQPAKVGHAANVYDGVVGRCPDVAVNEFTGRRVDWIVVSKQTIEVIGVDNNPDSFSKSASDHTPFITAYVPK